MINARFMYLRPGNLPKSFVLERGKGGLKNGRPTVQYDGDGTEFLKGFLTTATEADRAHGTADHIVTHIIVQSGGQQAERTDRLILGDRLFYIVDIDPACSLGIATIYYAEERTDVK